MERYVGKHQKEPGHQTRDTALPVDNVRSPGAQGGHLPQAKETLLATLNDPSIAGNRGRSVILGDLAAVEAAQHNPEAACDYAIQALDQLGRAWYATGMDRVLEVRKALQPSAELDCVQRLDDRLYDWQATSARSSVKHGDLAGQISQRINPQRRHPRRNRGSAGGRPPAFDSGRYKGTQHGRTLLQQAQAVPRRRHPL
jgi:hypothetical protein